MATLGNLYGVDVDHYIRINFAGFISIIDAIGGVDVYSDQAFTSVGSPGYYDPTTFAEGWNHLDGNLPLAFARERHAFKTGDIQRGINQMKVIDAMANKLKSPHPADELFQADGRRCRLLRDQLLAGADLRAGADAAGRPRQLGHPELHRHRLGRKKAPSATPPRARASTS